MLERLLWLNYLHLIQFFRLKKIEQEMDAEEAGRGQVTGELRMKKTQHMTTSRWGERGRIMI